MTRSNLRSSFLLIGLCLILLVPAAHAKDTITLKYFNGMTPAHYFNKDMLPFFAKEVEKRTNGRIKVEIYPGGELFGYVPGIDACTMGGVEMGLTALGHWGGYNPIFQFSDYFLLLSDYDHWVRARDSIYPVLETLFEKRNVKLLHFSAYGGNSLAGRVPINSVNDIKGLKVRAPVPGALACIAAWGGTPTKVAPAEVYDALSKGAIDSCVTSWSFMYSGKLYEVSKYFVGPIWWTVWVNFINMDTWNSIPKDLQKIILEVSKETEDLSKKLMEDFEKESLAKLKDVGQLKLLTDQEKKDWGGPLKSAYQDWLKKCQGAGTGEAAAKIIDALEKTR